MSRATAPTGVLSFQASRITLFIGASENRCRTRLSGRPGPFAPIMTGLPVSILRRAMAVAPGVCLGAYEIVSDLGVIGLGEVYTVHDAPFQTTAAVRLLARERRQRY
jgi:hypothetical protein